MLPAAPVALIQNTGVVAPPAGPCTQASVWAPAVATDPRPPYPIVNHAVSACGWE